MKEEACSGARLAAAFFHEEPFGRRCRVLVRKGRKDGKFGHVLLRGNVASRLPLKAKAHFAPTNANVVKELIRALKIHATFDC